MLRQGIGPLATRATTASATATEALLFDDRGSSDRVQNAIGDVAANTTIAQLRALRTVPNLLAEMLRVTRDPIAPVATNFGLSLLNFPTEAQAGATLQVSGIVRLDRGAWSVSGSAAPPYGAVTSAQVTESLSAGGATTALSVPSSQGRVVDLGYTSSVPVPATLGAYSFDVAVSYGAGEPFASSSVPAGSLTSSVQLRSFAPVLYGADQLNDAPANPSNSGLPSTPRVFADTTDVIVASHAWNDTIFVPKPPVEVAQYERALFRDFVVLQPSVTLITQVDKVVGGATLSYYAIEFPVFRGATDVRIRL